MRIKKLIYQIKPPCSKCPYTLGLIHTVKNPCPECKENGYQTFEWFKRKASGGAIDFINEEKGKGLKNGK